jgi:hypothetical protein
MKPAAVSLASVLCLALSTPVISLDFAASQMRYRVSRTGFVDSESEALAEARKLAKKIADGKYFERAGCVRHELVDPENLQVKVVKYFDAFSDSTTPDRIRGEVPFRYLCYISK